MSRPNLRSVAAVVALGIFTVRATVASADQNSVVVGDGGSAHVVNGVTTGFYPAVGALLLGDGNSGRSWCSGTLIGCQTFITAAHCVCPTNGTVCNDYDRPNPSAYTVFFQHAGFVGVDSITVHPSYQFPQGDLAILKLARPVTGITPIPLNMEGSPAIDTAGTIVGFGSSGGGKSDFGIKRSGRVAVADGMVSRGDGLVGWHFRGPMGDPGSNANTCSGDSGGPLLLEGPDGWMLGGTTTGGQNGSCMTDDVSIDTDVFTYADWIRDVAESDISTPCADTTADDDPIAIEGVLDEARPSAAHTVDVSSSTTLLRVTMNGIDDGRTNFNLELNGPDGSTRCTQRGAGQFAVCEITMPESGAWEVYVDRVAGSGPYQLNIATVAVDCARAENDGHACSDGNPCTRDDTCQAGACVSTTRTDDAPVCAPRTCSPTPRADCATSTALHQPLLTWPRRDGSAPTFTWRWTQTERGAHIDYGDPTAGTDYAFCVYDDADDLLMRASLRAGDGWYRYRRGFSYQGDQGRAVGVSEARLRTATRSRIAILVRGRGLNPIARVSRSNHNVHVRAQLQGDGGCWETGQMLAQKPRTK